MVSPNVAEKYISEYFSKKYQISKKRQPKFWEAVIMLCQDINSDVSSLIDDNQEFCCIAGLGFQHYSCIDTKEATFANSVVDLAKRIANQIIRSESANVSSVEFFVLQKKVEEIGKSIKRIDLLLSNDENLNNF